MYIMEKDIYADVVVKFSFLKLWLRVLALLFGGGILLANSLAFFGGEYSIISIIFGGFFFLAGLFDNSWEFDVRKKQAIQKKGLVFLPKKRIINFSAIHEIKIETFKQPARLGTFTDIFIVLKDGKEFVIDRDKTKRLTEELEGIAIVQDVIRRENT